MGAVENAGSSNGNSAPKKPDKNDSNGLNSAEEKPRGKTLGSQNGQTEQKKKRKRRKDTYRNYSNYIYKVLKSKDVHPNCGISKQAMSIMNSFVLDIVDRLANESAKLATYNKQATITARTIQSATRFVLHGGLLKHANSKGVIAVQTYARATGRSDLLR